MPECPCCFGAGEHDLRDLDAVVTEHLTDDELVVYRRIAPGSGHVVPCDECEGTGVVSAGRLAALLRQAAEDIARAVANMTEPDPA